MGKHYESELEALNSTMDWASKLDLSHWTSAVAKQMGRDLVVIASGGSIAAAQLLAQLHMAHTGHLAVVMTPLEFQSERRPIDAAVWLLSASGSNNDILQAWHATAIRGVRDVCILCAAPDSPLVRLAQNAGMPSMAFDPPAGRDGFLATNSLIAFLTIILRFYSIVPPAIGQLPKFQAPDLTRRTLIVLYGGWLKAVAVDLESRFTEAALGAIQISDYRNFAHGRHHWLAKHGKDTAVLALVSRSFTELAQHTLAALPTTVPVERWEFEDDSPAIALQGIHLAMKVAGVAASRMGYDAGRPGVPEFGHHIYDLKTKPKLPIQTSRELAIARKIQADGGEIPQDHMRMVLGLSRFESALYDANIAGVVMDYDGTLVASHRRFEDIDAAISAQLNRLLSAGLLLGIATGRGKSVHSRLRSAIDRAHWPQCTIGYYNGSVIRSLEDSCDELCSPIADPMIGAVTNALRDAAELSGAELNARSQQITLTRREAGKYELWMKVRRIVDRHAPNSLNVVYSSHSVDVVPLSSSKINVVTHLTRRCGTAESSILKIGDRGQWPGNDADLLAMSHGLSVDEISGNPDSCWNLAPAGYAGHLATLHYLQRIRGNRYEPYTDS